MWFLRFFRVLNISCFWYLCFCFLCCFSRLSYEYDLFCTNPLRPLLSLDCSVYIQTDKVRALYDTKEMVDTLLQMEYVSDEEVLANQAGVSPSLVQPEEKKQQRKTRLAMNRGGLLK